jgi:hypothetical protein
VHVRVLTLRSLSSSPYVDNLDPPSLPPARPLASSYSLASTVSGGDWTRGQVEVAVSCPDLGIELWHFAAI